MKNKFIIIAMFFVFGLMFQVPRVSADFSATCRGDCKIGHTCYPRLGYVCNTASTGNSCNDYYNCENMQ